MKIIYIEVTKDELSANKTLADSLCEAVNGFVQSIVRIKPVIEKEYKFKDDEDEEQPDD